MLSCQRKFIHIKVPEPQGVVNKFLSVDFAINECGIKPNFFSIFSFPVILTGIDAREVFLNNKKINRRFGRQSQYF